MSRKLLTSRWTSEKTPRSTKAIPHCQSSKQSVMVSDDGEVVQLYVYDLSNGLARQLSPMLLNKQVGQAVANFASV